MNSLFRLFVFSCFILSGCGGGGGSGSDPITINAPDVSQTDLSEIYLSGTSFIPEGSYCYTNQTIPFRYIPGGYSITWENLSNNSSGPAQIWQFCDPEISWSVLPAIPLVSGENQITVTVTTNNGTWQDSITVIRVSEITPPVVISFSPDDSSTGMYNRFISFTFNESVISDSL